MKKFRRIHARTAHTSGGWAGVVGVGASNGLSAATKLDTKDSGPVWVVAGALGTDCAVTAAVSNACGSGLTAGADALTLLVAFEDAVLTEADADVSLALPSEWLELFTADTTGCWGPSFDLPL